MKKLYSFGWILLSVHFMAQPAFSQDDPGQVYYDSGVFAYEDGDFEVAEKHLKKALSLNPDQPAFNHYLGRTYLKTGRFDEAEALLSRAWAVAPDLIGLKYDMALLRYKKSDYTRAASLFEEIAREDSSNVLAQYHAGLSFYQQKQYRKALEYFVRAWELSPSVEANGAYYAGICHLRLGETEKAVERFEYVTGHADEDLLREYAARWLESLESRKKAQKPYTLYLKLGLQYDSNVTLEPLDLDFISDEDDFLLQGYFSGKYRILEKANHELGVGYNHYQTWHYDLDQFDLAGGIFNLYWKYRWHPFTFDVSYLPEYYWLDSDSFLMRHHLRPEVTWRAGEKVFTRLTYSYFRNNHFFDDGRDGHANEIFLGGYYLLGGKSSYLFGGIGCEDTSTADPDQDYEQWKLRLGIVVEIPWDLQLSVTGRYYEQNYDHVDSGYGIRREDAKYCGSLSLSRKLCRDWLSLMAEFEYTKNDSNIDAFEYDRKVVTLSLVASY
ncbi:MAG: tetratricopeptide repeat protein [Deltaproteobacteria bacterium]|nr:tetratricopeptide repeat protein [Deltaproteobacteria bacterium]